MQFAQYKLYLLALKCILQLSVLYDLYKSTMIHFAKIHYIPISLYGNISNLYHIQPERTGCTGCDTRNHTDAPPMLCNIQTHRLALYAPEAGD